MRPAKHPSIGRCPHLGEHVADTRPKKKRACGHDWTAVFSCELHMLCTPFCKMGAKDESITSCHHCPDNPANAEAADK